MVEDKKHSLAKLRRMCRAAQIFESPTQMDGLRPEDDASDLLGA
jgi:hypothetical protein